MNELVDQYFEGTFTQEQKTAFDALLRTDREFREEFEFQQQVRAAITQKRRRELQELVQGFEHVNSKPWYQSRTWMSIAASVLLLSGVGLYFYQSTSVVEGYFQPLPNMIVPNVRDTQSVQHPSRQAFEFYELEHYKEAIKALEHLPAYNYKPIYLGISHLAMGQAKKALPYLQTPILDDSLSLDGYRNWYLALTYLELHQTAEAQTILEELTKGVHPIRAQAHSLLKSLP